MLVFGALATPMFVALVGWWPLNILFMLLLSTGIIWLIERGGPMHTALAVLSFALAGAVVEFWWFGVLTCLGAWAYCRRPTIGRFALWALSLGSLWLVNRNFAALASLPLLLAATHIDLPVARHRWLFYTFYPAHLAAVWLAMKLTS